MPRLSQGPRSRFTPTRRRRSKSRANNFRNLSRDIEAVYTVTSLDPKPRDLLSFRVLIPIVIDGVTVIDRGSLVTGRVAEARRAGHWGKAGRLSWTMQDVVAFDLTRVPLQAQNDLPTGRNGIRAGVTADKWRRRRS